jgi:hypothetical protein
MAETSQKLRPDRDLQCYFERPSAVAALSAASAAGFTLSGCWRQQFDWVVLEWNRDNVFEHPALRNLPDGDLSGLHLVYEDTRVNCLALDSDLYATVDWPNLRIWTVDGQGVETLHKVRLKNYATPVAGDFTAATMQFALQGTLTAGDYIELAWLDEHYNYLVASGDTAAGAVSHLASWISGHSSVQATASGNQITLTWPASAGANGNRVGVYGSVSGARTESWAPAAQTFSGGVSPSRWRVDLDFSDLHDTDGNLVPTGCVRKMRWTWAADLQKQNFERSEFSVVVSSWSVSGTGLAYSVAGPGSRRIEDNSSQWSYTGAWTEGRGNYSGGSLRWTTAQGAAAQCTYQIGATHKLYLGTRRAAACGAMSVTVDGVARTFDLSLAGEDVLIRLPLGELAGGQTHTVTVTHAGPANASLYLDFLEMAIPSPNLPDFAPTPRTTLATDWDTDHSMALAPERTAWLIHKLGFQGRANHYVGALWFYELDRPGHQYASGTVTYSGTPEFGSTTTLNINGTPFVHLNLIGDTAATIAKAFELVINQGSTGVWAQADGGVLTITSRLMGQAGNAITVNGNTTLTGGVDGEWRTDLAAMPRVNRAARDWSRSFFQALQGYAIDVAAAFSLELQHGDPGLAAGIAQRYPDGGAVLLNTPALQTNFSPTSTAFWRQVYLDMADVLAGAGLTPFLQFGEVQWWYFPNASGMTFYDDYTKSQFQALHGRALPVIATPQADPAQYPTECGFLAGLIGDFTDAVMSFVRQTYAAAKFEVLYPPDVNDAPLTRVVNLPTGHWTPAQLECFKTENFTFTGDRNLDKARYSIGLPMELGFPRAKASHLIGIGEYTTPWRREHGLAMGADLESVVLFALDQFCLIGYPLPVDTVGRRGSYQGR